MPPKNNKLISFQKMKSFVFFSLIISLIFLLVYIIKPFFYPLFWATIIAIMFYPTHKKILNKIKKPNLSASISLLLVLITIFLPLTIISIMVINKSVDLYNVASDSGLFTTNTVENISQKLSGTIFEPYLEIIKNDWTSYVTEFTKKFSSTILNTIKNLTQNSFRLLFMLFIMFYTLFYLFKDGQKILDHLMYISPLGTKNEKMLYEKFTSATRATLKSTLIVGTIQGSIGGILFWFVGIKGAFIWGVLMTLLSLIPAIGPFVVWMPVGLISLALGNIWQGIVILIFGFFVISTVDNLLKPPLIGKDIQIHPLLILFSTLGGLLLFGLAGFVIGPIVSALFIAVLSIYEENYKHELDKN